MVNIAYLFFCFFILNYVSDLCS